MVGTHNAKIILFFLSLPVSDTKHKASRRQSFTRLCGCTRKSLCKNMLNKCTPHYIGKKKC